jgi:DNA-binding transcriptional LysR family regulator
MDLGELESFLTVAREKSFSRAAAKLYRTQPAISIAVRKLEDWVGQPLFVRGSRPALLTDAGETLREYAERMLNFRDEIRQGLDDLSHLRRGRVSLGANESSIHALLSALARYRRLFPEVQILVQRTFSRDIPGEVLNYRLDFGVISFVPREEKLAAVEFLRDALTLVVHPRHRLARRRTVDISELGQEIFIAHIVESPYRWRVIQLFEKHRVPLNMAVQLPTIESIKRFVRMQMGVAIVPRTCVRQEIEQGELVEVKIKQLRVPRRLFLIYRRDSKPSRAAAELMRLLRSRSN